ncbi:MAG: hypothetical protein ACFB15_27495 [Cyclobacteriaceae bacterium]
MKFLTITSILLCFLFAFSFDVSAQFVRATYTNPDFDQLARNHKTLAIIPFNVSAKLRPKQMRNMTEEELDQLEEREGKAMQNALHSYFLMRKRKRSLSIDFQDVTRTNSLLAKNGITYDVLGAYTSEDLAEMLGVDGIVSGMIFTDKPVSEVGAIAIKVLLGESIATNTGKVAINISDGKTEQLLWKYEKELSRNLGSNTNQIVNALMRKASRKFPYSSR